VKPPFRVQLLAVVLFGLLGGIIFAVVENEPLEWLCLFFGGAVILALLEVLYPGKPPSDTDS
jgi:hypothetical protein